MEKPGSEPHEETIEEESLDKNRIQKHEFNNIEREEIIRNPEVCSEVVIYKRLIDRSDALMTYQIMYQLTGIKIDLAVKLLFAVLLLCMNYSKTESFRPFAIFMVFYFTYMLAFNLFCIFKYGEIYPEFKKAHLFDIVFDIIRIFFYAGLYLFLSGQVSYINFTIFIFIHVMFNTCRMCLVFLMRTPYLPFSSFLVTIYPQILYLASKLINPNNYAIWKDVFFWVSGFLFAMLCLDFYFLVILLILFLNLFIR